MYYIVGEHGLSETNRKCFEECSGSIGIFDEEEWNSELELLKEFSLRREDGNVFFCKLENHASYLFGMFHIPVKKKEKRSFNFAVYILRDRLIFIEEESYIDHLVCSMQKKIGDEVYTIEQFLGDFFMMLVEEDTLYLASLERKIADMEEQILRGDTEHFHYCMLGIKKEISRLYCYYSQMTDVGESLAAWDNSCSRFPERVGRMKQEAQSLREYAMQVQDVYQSEISIHQNNVMKFLTVVTTIFLPLSLVAGWYGMNFYNMPELSWKYGYPVVAGISLIILIVCLWFFKKKKFF